MKKYILYGYLTGLFFLVGIFLTIADLGADRHYSANDKSGESGGLKSLEWWYAQRALPHELIPVRAFEKAARYSKTAFAKREGIDRQISSVQPWASLGPYDVGGRILAIAIHSAHPNTIWAGSASGGLWKSTQGGIGTGAWSYVNTGFNVLSVSAVAIDHSNENIIYIGTGEISRYQRPLVGTPGARASYGMGILKSIDGGTTWIQTGLTWTFPEITAVQKIVMNPLNPNTIYAAASEGVFKSVDAGSSWTRSNAVLMAMDIVMNSSDTSVLYSSHGNLNSSPNPGIYKTTNAGTSWVQLTNGLPAVDFGRTALAISQSNPSAIYAGISDAVSGGINGLYKSTDNGSNWTKTSSTNYVGSQGWYDNVIATHPDNSDSIYCAGLDIHQSTNGGTTFSNISMGVVHVDHHAIAYDPTNPDIVYFGTDGGIYKTTNGGESFLNCNYGLQTTQFYPGFANSPQDSTVAIGGLQDNGTLMFRGTKYWPQIFYNDGGWCAIDPTNKNIMYFEYQYLALYKSTDGGITSSPITNGLPTGSSNTNFIPPFIIAPSEPQILYAGSKNVYKSTNGGAFWFPSNNQTQLNGTNIACIGVAWKDATKVITGTGTGAFGVTPKFEIFVSPNGGSSWGNVTTNLNGTDSLPNRYPTDIEFDPTDDRTAYLTYSGYGTPHLFKTTNLGDVWMNISGNLPDIPHQAVCLDPEAPENIYIGTDLGVYHSSDYGISWEIFDDGMPPAMVLDVTISRANNKLRASTFGNGVYERQLARLPQLSLVAPNGGEVWVGDFPEYIRWTQRFLSTVKLEYTTDNGWTWNLIAGGVPASQGMYQWTPPADSTTMARIRISDETDILIVDSSDTPFSIVINPDYYYGWNLVSIPLTPTDPRVSSIFPAAVTKAFLYDKSYVSSDTLMNGNGYWLKFNLPQFISFTGDSIFTDTIDIKKGWNMIGSISIDVPISDIIEIPDTIVTSQYYGYRQSYFGTDTLKPRWGYWVKTKSDGQLVFSTSSAFGKREKHIKTDLSIFNTLTIRDKIGNEQILYFGKDYQEFDSYFYELPPLPPDGIFDVRFQSNHQVETMRAKETLPIAIQSRTGVTVSWNIRDKQSQYYISRPGREDIVLTGEGNAAIEHPASSMVIRAAVNGVTTTPLTFKLEQNYPNPFNPITVIRYQLPNSGDVTLKIYNISGQEVATLVDGVQNAGFKSVEFNASHLASGVYYYKLTSGVSVEVRKMVVIR